VAEHRVREVAGLFVGWLGTNRRQPLPECAGTAHVGLCDYRELTRRNFSERDLWRPISRPAEIDALVFWGIFSQRSEGRTEDLVGH
jgi:hypothetical protein